MMTPLDRRNLGSKISKVYGTRIGLSGLEQVTRRVYDRSAAP